MRSITARSSCNQALPRAASKTRGAAGEYEHGVFPSLAAGLILLGWVLVVRSRKPRLAGACLERHSALPLAVNNVHPRFRLFLRRRSFASTFTVVRTARPRKGVVLATVTRGAAAPAISSAVVGFSRAEGGGEFRGTGRSGTEPHRTEAATPDAGERGEARGNRTGGPGAGSKKGGGLAFGAWIRPVAGAWPSQAGGKICAPLRGRSRSPWHRPRRKASAKRSSVGFQADGRRNPRLCRFRAGTRSSGYWWATTIRQTIQITSRSTNKQARAAQVRADCGDPATRSVTHFAATYRVARQGRGSPPGGKFLDDRAPVAVVLKIRLPSSDSRVPL